MLDRILRRRGYEQTILKKKKQKHIELTHFTKSNADEMSPANYNRELAAKF